MGEGPGGKRLDLAGFFKPVLIGFLSVKTALCRIKNTIFFPASLLSQGSKRASTWFDIKISTITYCLPLPQNRGHQVGARFGSLDRKMATAHLSLGMKVIGHGKEQIG